jgi:predicted benzoate:H+ symporter BenE
VGSAVWGLLVGGAVMWLVRQRAAQTQGKTA